MKILHLSDPHLRGDEQLSFGVVNTPRMMQECVDHICSLDWKPEATVISGDLADSGADDAYEALIPFLKRLPGPLFVLPGNHDRRERLLHYLSDYCPVDPSVAPYICYVCENLPIRLVFFDSTSPGSHSGHLHAPVAEWLEKTLSAQPERPTLLFTHHPPFLTGFGMMDEPYENADLLAKILSRFPNVRFCCGHIHRPITTLFAGCVAVTCPSIAMQIEFDLRPEGGDEFRMETAGYMVHHWIDGSCNSHICQIPSKPSFSGPHRFAGSVNPV